ncbi:hypothetical protein OPV22_023184 [Ensete ventricosum]|uniref:Uncharacterized protein n=1 Tax=Ensete ventricosum TaxID=4639 RepID=A0AAV8QL81_ENSVE|nr:hypothetical protein OPV22_023184 [Ensete ventricosum]
MKLSSWCPRMVVPPSSGTSAPFRGGCRPSLIILGFAVANLGSSCLQVGVDSDFEEKPEFGTLELIMRNSASFGVKMFAHVSAMMLAQTRSPLRQVKSYCGSLFLRLCLPKEVYGSCCFGHLLILVALAKEKKSTTAQLELAGEHKAPTTDTSALRSSSPPFVYAIPRGQPFIIICHHRSAFRSNLLTPR